VLLLGVLLAYLALRTLRGGMSSPILKYGPSLAFVLYVAQAMVGAANIWTLLQPAAAAAHLALAELLWAMLVTIAGVTQLSTAQTARAVLAQRESAPAQLRAHATAGERS
jgi:heme A synthase